MSDIDADLTGAIWRKSRRSNSGGNCVEVASSIPGIVAVRDSKNPEGHERYAKLLAVIVLHGADLRPPRSSVLEVEGFA